MRSNFSTYALVVCSLLPMPSSHSLAQDIELYVAPGGDDEAVGSQEQPLASIFEAQRRVRELRAEDTTKSAFVWFHQGVYSLTAPVTFTADDSADQQGTTTYAALPGHRVHLRGGAAVNDEHTTLEVSLPHAIPAAALPHVRVVDLSRLGIDEVAPHPRRSRHALMQPTSIELFQSGQRLPAAGWPNQGWAQVPAAPSSSHTWPIDNKMNALAQSTGAWAHGFWNHDWQDSCEPITLAPTSRSGSSAINQLTIENEQLPAVRPGARFRIEHLLSELDSPGEWFVDHERNLLYVWPLDEGSLGSSSQEPFDAYFVSTLDTPISCYDCERFTFRGLTIEGARAACIEIVGGRNVTLDDCVIRHAGNLGVNIFHGFEHRVTNCQITVTGAGAIRVEGGDRETLTPAQHTIEQNHLHDYSQLQWCYRPAVNVYGVGITVQNNEIDHAPHAAIILHGNDHRILKNHVHHVCTETDDVGAIYLAHNPTHRGNIISQNYIHDLGGFSRTGVIGIYLDDFASGTEVSRNVLRNAGRGVAIGGGRDNLIDGNLFIDCLAAIQIDNRGTGWAKNFVEGEQSPLSLRINELAECWELHTQRYPELAQLMNDSPAIAKGNRIRNNLYQSPIGVDIQAGLDPRLVVTENNLGNARELLVDIDAGDYRWKATTPGEPDDYQPVNLSDIGLPAKATRTFVRRLDP